MDYIHLATDLKISRIVHGHMRLAQWNLSNQQLVAFTEQVIGTGINALDHADIYGDYRCEKLFGDALRLKPGLREEILIITKCGIQLISDRFPTRKLKHYEYSYEHIVSSVERSLKNFNTDYIDLLLLHRPAPLFDPEKVARAFSYLKEAGKVLHFGVSNFTPGQVEMLGSYTSEKLVTNQVELSPYCLEQFENGNIDYCLKKRIKPMAWSPLARGKLGNQADGKGERIIRALEEVAAGLQVGPIEKIIYSWILNHPVSAIPIVGSGKLDRVKQAVESLDIVMSTEQWYKIYTASTGKEVP